MVMFNKPQVHFFESNLSDSSQKALIALGIAVKHNINQVAIAIAKNENLHIQDAMKHAINSVLCVSIVEICKTFDVQPSEDLVKKCTRQIVESINSSEG